MAVKLKDLIPGRIYPTTQGTLSNAAPGYQAVPAGTDLRTMQLTSARTGQTYGPVSMPASSVTTTSAVKPSNISGTTQTVNPLSDIPVGHSSTISGAIAGLGGAPIGTQVTPVNVDTSKYNWDTGAGYLTPDSPMVRPVAYQNEFSPATTASMANDIYNQYYAPYVQEQQAQNIREYQRSANRQIENVKSDRAAAQLQAQATREATAANTLLQQEQYLAAFSKTLDARKVELDNKIQDFNNAWQEVSTYGYVVTEGTANILGIAPGQQLTTLSYKNIMSNIAAQVAAAEAQKVQLAQDQAKLDLQYAQFEESKREFDLSYAQQQAATNNTLYNRLTDMLQRSDTVTPAIQNLAAQLNIPMTLGESTAKYYTSTERLDNLQALFGEGATDITAGENIALSNKIGNAVSNVVQTGNVNFGGTKRLIPDASAFNAWLTKQITSGVPVEQVVTEVMKNPQKIDGLRNLSHFVNYEQYLPQLIRNAYTAANNVVGSGINRTYGS